MKNENEIISKPIPFIEIHEKNRLDMKRLINIDAIEVIESYGGGASSWIRCRNWRSSEGILVTETYEELKEKIWNALSK